MKTNILPVLHTGNPNVSTLTVSLPDSNKTLTGSMVHQHGSKLGGVDRDLTGARPLTLSDQQSPSSINDNYCRSCVKSSVCSCDWQRDLYYKLCNRKQQLCLYNRKGVVDRKAGLFCDWQEGQCKNFDCKLLSCCRSFWKRICKRKV